MARHLLALLSLTVLAASPALACDFDDENGLDVGLVLSGGGAKSSTQVGFMQIMDALDIPIHCVAGTSMGAVVGAFYASGYSADEIGEIFIDEDWGAAFRGTIPRTDKSFIQKEREETYFSGDIIGLSRDGLELPSALNSMQGLQTLYRDILRNVPVEIDFDDLSIPFRAVATDLETGRAVAFEEGDLVSAVLASMAVPGVFAPRIIDGVPYVDGGISSNLPVQTALDMGADIIIALDTTAAPRPSDGRYSIGETLQQVSTIMVYRNAQLEKQALSKRDLYVEPNRIDIGTSAYTESAAGLKVGRNVGHEHKDALLRIRDLAAPSKRKPRLKPNLDQPETLTLVNNSLIADDVIKRRVNDILSLDQDSGGRDRRLRELASFGSFGEVDLGYSSGEAVLTVSPNSIGRTRLKIGANVASNFDGAASFSLLAQLTRQPIGPRGGDVSLSAELGTNTGLSLELYQPLGVDSHYFIQPELFIRSEKRELDLIDIRVGDFLVETQGIRARLGRELSSWGLIALEGEIQDGRFEPIVTIDPTITAEHYSFGSVGAYFGIDTLDRTDWPTGGRRVQLRAQQFFDISEDGALDANRYEASWLQAFSAGSYGALLNLRHGKLNTDGVTVGFDSTFELGGFRQLSGFRERSLPVERLNYASLEVFKRLSNDGFLVDIPVYIGGLAEYARIPFSALGLDDVEDALSLAAYMGAETPLGPAFIGTAFGNNNDLRFFFRFGRTF